MTRFPSALSSMSRVCIAAMVALTWSSSWGSEGNGGKVGNGVLPTAVLPAATLRVLSLPVPQSYRHVGHTSEGNQVFLSEPVAFSIPANAVSFQLYMRHGDAELACLNQVVNPTNVDILAIGARSILNGGVDYCSALVPKGPQFVAQAGRWRYRIIAANNVPDDIRVTLALRTGALPTNASTLAVQPFLASATRAAVDIQPALEEMRRIYAQAGITLQIAKTIVLTEPAFRIVSDDFTNPITRQLVVRGRAGFVNLFFVDDFARGAGLLGITAGVPGELGKVSNRNGVLIGLSGHLDPNQQLNANFMGETTAHEMGHHLGLFHTTELNGRLFDILPDTPICPRATRDRNRDGIMSLMECRGLDANNLMFWTGNGIIRQTGITPDQAHVVNFSPIARISQ